MGDGGERKGRGNPGQNYFYISLVFEEPGVSAGFCKPLIVGEIVEAVGFTDVRENIEIMERAWKIGEEMGKRIV